MMRLDRFLSELQIGTRSQIKDWIRNGTVTVNGAVVSRPEVKVSEAADQICFKGKLCRYRPMVYYMLNKPAGVVSAVRDNTCRTVVELLKDTGRTDLFPVGRLDKDTEGLLLLTNDGALAHQLLAPGRHVEKTYLVATRESLTERACEILRRGVDIGEKRPTLPAKAAFTEDGSLLLTITEGKFHQVKRMIRAAGGQVKALKRLTMGPLKLDESLRPGEYRELTEEELRLLEKLEGNG